MHPRYREVFLDRVSEPLRRRISRSDYSLILWFEAVHMILLSLVLASYLGLPTTPLVAPDTLWKAWVFSGGLSGLVSEAFRESSIPPKTGLTIMVGADFVILSHMIEQSAFTDVLAAVGAVMMSGVVLISTCLQLRDAQEIFSITGIHATALFFLILLSPLLVVGMWGIWSCLPIGVITHRFAFDISYIERSWTWFYPITRWVFILLVTAFLWLPMLVRVRRWLPDEKEFSVSSVGVASQKSFRHGLLLVLPVSVGAFMSSYPFLLGYPLTGDAEYYLSILRQMSQFGVSTAFSTDRPVFFIILHLLGTSLSVDGELLLMYLSVVLTCTFVAATYLLMDSLLGDERLAILTAFFAALSTRFAIGPFYFIAANSLALNLMMMFFIAILRVTERGTRVSAIGAIALSWLVLGVHFPTWGLMMTILTIHTIVSLRKGIDCRHASDSVPFKVVLGCLSAVVPVFILGVTSSAVSATINNAWSRVIDFLSRVNLLEVAVLLRDEKLLSSHLTAGCYATPLTYGAALLGLYHFYSMRDKRIRLLLSWAAVVSFGLLIVGSEHWRLLYMMPLELLATTGLFNTLRSWNLLKNAPTSGLRREQWARTALALGAIAGATVLLNISTSPALALVTFSGISWVATRKKTESWTRLMLALECVLIYTLMSTATILSLLR
ncbi:MAG: hypothetical protein V1857_06325 [archaeon]